MDKLPSLPFSAKALEIALNGVTIMMLMPFVAYAMRRQAQWIDLLTLLVFGAAIGLYLSNMYTYFFTTPGVR